MSGGGFMSQGAGSQGSPSKKNNTNSSIRPVTIHQILLAQQDHPDAEWTIDGAGIGNVTFVAAVRNISKSASNHVLIMEDGTGAIDCRKWVDASGRDDEAEMAELKDKYVRVVGTIKSFSGKMHVQCANVRVLEDMHEVLFHIVEAIHVSLSLIRGPAPTSRGAAVPARAGANPYTSNDNAAAGGAYLDLSNTDQKILGVITSFTEAQPEGVNVGAIARSVGITEQAVRDACARLTNEGHLYSTIDDDHVLTTA